MLIYELRVERSDVKGKKIKIARRVAGVVFLGSLGEVGVVVGNLDDDFLVHKF